MCEDYISNDQYHRSQGLSASMLTALDQSPAHLKSLMTGKKKPPTKQMILGTRVHRILESWAGFHEDYTVRPDGIDGRTGPGRTQLKEIKASGKEIVDACDWEDLYAIHKAVATSEDRLVNLVWSSAGERESSIYWNDGEIVMKCRPDKLVEVTDSDENEWLSETWPSLFNPICNRICVDYKTFGGLPTYDSFKWRLRSKMEKGGYGYGLAASHYLAGTKADAFMWLVIETSPPFTVTRFLMSPQTKAIYDQRREVLIEQYKDCREYDNWPGISITNEETML